jgi:1,4-alpha-glucan branching enzyme
VTSQRKPRAEALPEDTPQPEALPDPGRREELRAVVDAEPATEHALPSAEAPKHRTLADDPHWYKDAIIYQLHVKAYQDSSGDGIGDMVGLTRRLDYIASLGVTAVWLLPFYPSPMRDDGYDIADYTNVHPDYGTRRDFRTFVREAHKRGLRVITELVVNHTSDLHPWFGESRSARDNPKRDW